HIVRVGTVWVDRRSVQQRREPDAPHERCTEARRYVRAEPRAAPARALALLPPLEGGRSPDQQHEQEQQREVEAREHCRVPGWERGEGGAAGDDEPGLVAVPV